MNASDLPVTDPFSDLQTATRLHRARHGCGAYTYDHGSLPGVLAAAVGALKVVEVGTALGYTACWLSSATPTTHVDTIENDPEHVVLARDEIARYGLTGRINVHQGDAESVLPAFDGSDYDVAFFDGFAPTMELIELLRGCLRDGGLLIAGNLTLGNTDPLIRELSDATQWRTHSLGETAICVKASRSQPTTIQLIRNRH